MKLPYDPVILLLGIYPKEHKTGYSDSGNNCTPMFLTALFIKTKLWKQTRCPMTHEWIEKMYIYTMEYDSVIRNNDMWFEGK
jgi:hypothetical protein